MISADGPFVLFDDGREGSAVPARLYRSPVEIVRTADPEAVSSCLAVLREAAERGLHAAGYLAYEAGHSLEARLAPLRRNADAAAPPLLWFGLFADVELIPAGAVRELLAEPCGAWAGRPRPLVSQADYEAAVARVQEHILAGDVYQTNLTFAAEVPVAGNPVAIYAGLRERARAGHGGLLFTGEHWLLSLSPELFFTVSDGAVTARPMKGTAIRRSEPAADAEAAAALAGDPKQRAENLMIVDLIRNDLSRVARPGSVEVPALFEVETYPTVHQLTSTVTARLEEQVDPVALVEAIFPCGSITGAPKIRAMEILSHLENRPRGPYTGSIGWIAPDGEATFNVAIRTLTMRQGESRATLGLGAGIVADSRAGDEWRECLAKGAFVAGDRRFDLIETMRFDPRTGIADLDRHLARMKRSADALGFTFDRHDARNELQAATFRSRTERQVRLMLSPGGAVAIETRPVPAPPQEPVEVAILPLPVAADDFRLRHKTSDRAFYDDARRASGRFEVLFEDGEGFLTEGSFTTIFVERGGRLSTPPLARSLIPGILRQRLLEEGEAVEEDLTCSDLADGFLIGNSLRGLIRAELVAPAQDRPAAPRPRWRKRRMR